MSGSFVTLRNFSENELIFDEMETRDILKFFFPHVKQRIHEVPMTTALRNFAQGLLVEAIDATYALGYVEILLNTFYSPSQGLKKALMKAAKKAARHWFKHATDRNLHNARVAESVRRQLSNAFATPMQEQLDGLALAPMRGTRLTMYVRYRRPSRLETVWG